MYLQLITAPTQQPIDIATARAHVREPTTANDAQIQTAIDGAIAHLDGKDGILGRALCTQTWELVLDRFPCGRDRIRVPLPPLQSVTSIKYIDPDGAEQTLDTGAYVVEPAAEPGIVEPVSSWPSTKSRVGAVRIRFVAGYTSAALVPSGIRSFLLLLIGALYENREASIVGTNVTDNPVWDRLIFPYRVRLIG